MKAVRRTLGAVVLALALAGCGIPPTGVLDAGEPAEGLTTALRLYYVRDARLQGVSRPDLSLDHVEGISKLLLADPTPAEQERGLTNLVDPSVRYQVSAPARDRVTVSTQSRYFSEGDDTLLMGQWVCTLARVQASLHSDVQPDDVKVTVDGIGRPLGPYRCSQFLRR